MMACKLATLKWKKIDFREKNLNENYFSWSFLEIFALNRAILLAQQILFFQY